MHGYAWITYIQYVVYNCVYLIYTLCCLLPDEHPGGHIIQQNTGKRMASSGQDGFVLTKTGPSLGKVPNTTPPFPISFI